MTSTHIKWLLTLNVFPREVRIKSHQSEIWHSLIFTACKRSLRRLCFHRCLSVHGWGACMPGGAYVAGGMCGRVHAWQGGMCGRGHAWQGACVAGGMHGRGVWIAGGVPPGRYYMIRSMSGRYASYWNAFLFQIHSSWSRPNHSSQCQVHKFI